MASYYTQYKTPAVLTRETAALHAQKTAVRRVDPTPETVMPAPKGPGAIGSGETARAVAV